MQKHNLQSWVSVKKKNSPSAFIVRKRARLFLFFPNTYFLKSSISLNQVLFFISWKLVKLFAKFHQYQKQDCIFRSRKDSFHVGKNCRPYVNYRLHRFKLQTIYNEEFFPWDLKEKYLYFFYNLLWCFIFIDSIFYIL